MATKVLLVEDDADQALLFSRVLERIGYAVTQTTTAARAQAYLRTEPYALLLADWDLGGGMAGDTLIVWAKKEQPGLKTVLFSNHPELDAVAAASGADAAFRKISGVDLLRQLIIRLAPA